MLPDSNTFLAGYSAIIVALKRAKGLGATAVNLGFTQESVVDSINGKAELNGGEAILLCRTAVALLRKFRNGCHVAKVSRVEATAARKLAKQAFDREVD